MQSQIKEKKLFSWAHHLLMVMVAAVFFSPASFAAKAELSGRSLSSTSTKLMPSGCNILIIGDTNQAIHQQLINGLKKELSDTPNNIVSIAPDLVGENLSIAAKADLIVPLGLAAAKSANKLSSDVPIFFTLLPKTLAEDFTECSEQECTQTRSALFLDQPASRQINLIKLLFPAINQLSFLYGDFSISAASELNELAKKSGYKVDIERIKNSDQLPRKLNTLFQESELFITLPDPLIHNRQTIPQLLLSSYRHRIPVIGFSESYVSAGAIAAVFSSLNDLVKEITDVINAFEKTGQLTNRNGYPNHFSVQINKDVARSMNLHLPSPSLIHKGLLSLEKDL